MEKRLLDLEGERDDAGCERSRRRRARVLDGARIEEIRRRLRAKISAQFPLIFLSC